MTGYQLAAAARRLRPGLKVLFTTGFAASGTETVVETLSAETMLSKPYRKQELATTIRAVLEA
jgi:CheY-like chemotaxis protein